MPGIATGRLLDGDAILSDYSYERAVSVADVEACSCPRLMETAAVSSTVQALGVEVAAELGQELLDLGAPGLHFYTLNRSTSTREVCLALGLGPADQRGNDLGAHPDQR